MSIRCQSWVYQHSEARGNDRLVLLAIADEANDDGTNAYPGIVTIAHKARVNKRTTMRCIDRLEEDGRLIVQRPETSGRGHHNTYIVVMSEPPAEAPKGDTLSPLSAAAKAPENGQVEAQKGDKRARKGAQPYLNGDRPIDPGIDPPPLPPPQTTHDPPPTRSEEEDSDALTTACRLEAERRLATRTGPPITNRSRWLATVAGDVRAELAGADLAGLSAQAIAELIHPAARPIYPVAGQARAPAWDLLPDGTAVVAAG